MEKKRLTSRDADGSAVISPDLLTAAYNVFRSKADYEWVAKVLAARLADYEDTEREPGEIGRMIALPETGIGDLSDGYHTFNELYHHRAVLFSVICNQNKDTAWKSKQHYDGTMYDGMFIVGIDTPEGQATYHYDVEPYWKMFRAKELDQAPPWDGHTPDEAIKRIANLVRAEARTENEAGQKEKKGGAKT